jgi:hypothetical protein
MKQIFTKSIYITLLSMLCAWNLNAQEMYNITAIPNPPQGGVIVGSSGLLQYGFNAHVAAVTFGSWAFINWTEDGVEISTDAAYNFVVTGDRILTANFVPAAPFEITVSPYPASGGTVSGGGLYEYGTIAVVTATPAPNYDFLYWANEDGEIFSALTPYPFIVTGNLHLFAHFAPATIEITLSKNIEEGGTIDGAGSYSYGETVIIDATPNLPEYEFGSWTENGNLVTKSYIYAFTATHSRHFDANFKPATYDIHVYANPNEGGTVTGGGIYPYGASGTLKAVAKSGYHFLNWTKFVSGNGTVVSTEPNYTFEVTGPGWGNSAFVAYFEIGEGEALSIDPIDAGAMMIYPNPTNADMKVVLNDLTLKIVEMELYDYTGKKVHQQTVNQSSETLPMNDLATGAYILKVYLDQGDVVTWKVVKN